MSIASIIILKYFSPRAEYGKENIGVEVQRFSTRVRSIGGRRCAIASGPISFNTIVEASRLEAGTVSRILLQLELLGLVSMRQGFLTPVLLSRSRVSRKAEIWVINPKSLLNQSEINGTDTGSRNSGQRS
ncbi:DprA-like winged helix domain-containing protein [Microcoleus sp. T3_B1]|uniref:DprA-like winged helix domain-containing protein n=1 Tax=Microcoleus sp. T3_B1 TaxID=3055425 RepID=UPI002FD5D718